jgi:hypothetical protein
MRPSGCRDPAEIMRVHDVARLADIRAFPGMKFAKA